MFLIALSFIASCFNSVLERLYKSDPKRKREIRCSICKLTVNSRNRKVDLKFWYQ